jgi:predicted DNA-binding transcriptional regulator AlpA
MIEAPLNTFEQVAASPSTTETGVMSDTKRDTSRIQWHNFDRPKLTVADVADALNVCARKVWRLVAASELPKPVYVGGSARWFMSDMEEYFQKIRDARERRQ